jgi:hypothetical protein
MLVEYLIKNKSYYDINGVQILMKCGRTHALNSMKRNVITTVKYLNRILYTKDQVIELTNLKNLKKQINLRINPVEEEPVDLYTVEPISIGNNEIDTLELITICSEHQIYNPNCNRCNPNSNISRTNTYK